VRVFFDTEFLDLGDRVELLSLGAVDEYGKTFYAERGDCPLALANEWVQKNVIPHMTGPVMDDATLRAGFRAFCGANPQFWAYYATYDAMLLFRLFGGFMEFPWPQIVHDLQTAALLKRRHTFPEQRSTEHHALNDALWNKQVYEYIFGND
jgi:hypothetical protein